MKKLLLVIAALLITCDLSVAQGRTIAPPTINYSQYGSYSRQLTVYRNVQAQLDADARRRYRKFREEVRRQVARERPRTIVVVQRRSTYEYGDAMRAWRERRNRR